MKFKLGDRVKDKYSGIEGTVYCIETSLVLSEARIRVERDGVDSNGHFWPEVWLFEGRLEKL